MRLRRLEIIVIGVTLAFACFIGGFFTGRSWSVVNVVPAVKQNDETLHPISNVQPPGASSIPVQGNTSDEPAQTATTDTQAGTEQAQHDPNTAASPDATGAPTGGDGRININLASQSELTDLPGIGNVLASRIIDYRRQHGDFKRIEDIKNVSGIGEKRYEAIQEKITVG